MTSSDVKEALRARHPGANVGSMVGQWTCIEEWLKIDLLALNAWSKADVIGYEVKVSRGDMRTELLNPWKRRDAVSRCTEFYFAVPKGLLKKEELEFKEPEWTDAAFERGECPGVPEVAGKTGGRYPRARKFGGRCMKRKKSSYYGDDIPKTGHYVTMPPDPGQPYSSQYVWCPSCNGKGYQATSIVEQQAPILWIPRDAGLIEVDGRGCHVVKKAPKNKEPKPIAATRQQMNDLVRWVSHRPDPRHR